MLSDYKILGIEYTLDINIVKSAFRKRIKELHPDLATDENAYKQHLLFVETCNAYKRIVNQTIKDPIQVREPNNTTPSTNARNGIRVYSDPAYAFYKNGIRYYSRIHPSQWNIDTNRMLNTRIAGQDEDQKIIKNKIMELVRLFPKAYYYFSIVVHEYPESEWFTNAREKMDLIENRTRMYKKIIESFTTWNIDKKAMIDSYNKMYNKHMKTHDDLNENDKKDWKK
jgi:hypothetical protein